MKGGELSGHGPRVAVVENRVINPRDSDDFSHRARAEDFVSLLDLSFWDVADVKRDFFIGTHFDDGVSGNSRRACFCRGG